MCMRRVEFGMPHWSKMVVSAVDIKVSLSVMSSCVCGVKPAWVTTCLHISMVTMSGFDVNVEQLLHMVRVPLQYFIIWPFLFVVRGLSHTMQSTHHVS